MPAGGQRAGAQGRGALAWRSACHLAAAALPDLLPTLPWAFAQSLHSMHACSAWARAAGPCCRLQHKTLICHSFEICTLAGLLGSCSRRAFSTLVVTGLRRG